MGKIEKVRVYVNGILDRIDHAENKHIAYIHTYGVLQCCALLAVKRGLDLELATAIGLLHDAYAYQTGITALHSHNGADMIKVAFKHRLAGIFTADEQTIIKSAIYHHSDKSHVHDAYDELLKDGDTLQHLSFDNTFGWIYGQRLLHIAKELSLPRLSITILQKRNRWQAPLYNPAWAILPQPSQAREYQGKSLMRTL